MPCNYRLDRDRIPGMRRDEAPLQPHWRAILTFYFLACAFQWPFFWWRDVHTASWNASRIPVGIRDLTWGPAVAAFVVFYLFPRARTRTISFFGASRARSLCSFLIPILFSWIGVAIQSGRISYKLIYYLLIGGVSMFGEEMGWRGFLQCALRPLGRVRGYLLLAFMWEAWHFTSHTKSTMHQVIERLAVYVPLLIVITFFLGFLTERTGSVLLATTIHDLPRPFGRE